MKPDPKLSLLANLQLKPKVEYKMRTRIESRIRMKRAPMVVNIKQESSLNKKCKPNKVTFDMCLRPKREGSIVASLFEDDYPRRGRPRAYMGEFDISLIREFRARPAFYDRNHYRFRDKVFTAREWQEISNKLGYDVSLLKDRMLQLRNRYNLEKRRLEQLNDESPVKEHDSPWPLYEHLQFLSDHIRARRSYKRMVTLHQNSSAIDYNHSNSYSSGSVMCHAAAPFANGMLTVKVEEEENDNATEAGIDSENASHENENSNNLPPPNQLITVTEKHSKKNQPYLPKITIRRLATENDDMLHSAAPKRARMNSQHVIATNKNQQNENRQQQQQPPAALAAATAAAAAAGIDYDRFLPPRLSSILQQSHNLTTRDQKFAAFGEFIFKSLLELPSEKAMLLIQNFTTDIVKTQVRSASTCSNDDSVTSNSTNTSAANEPGDVSAIDCEVQDAAWVNGEGNGA